MTLKVPTERQMRVGSEETVWHTLREMRTKAVRTGAYFYGETWRLVNYPRTLMFLSKCYSLEQWHQWVQEDHHDKDGGAYKPYAAETQCGPRI